MDTSPRPAHNPIGIPDPPMHIPPPPYPPLPPAPPTIAAAMPGQVRTARLVLFVHAGLMPLLALAQLVRAQAARDSLSPHGGPGSWMAPVVDDARHVADAQILSAQSALVWAILYAAVGTALAVRLARGGRAWRIGAIVYGAWHGLGGLFALALANGDSPTPPILTALAQIAAGIALLALLTHKDSTAWSARTR
ncbi:hypothetical protein [Kitasatospora sp. NPDC058218]|uniref:hypothetical protein n=1 Tax=Kitasatospora sp. NPDC058218 TaxID=3346385 RepID=UPI0036DD8976